MIRRNLFGSVMLSNFVFICVGLIMKHLDLTIDDKLFYLFLGIPAPVFLCLAISVFSRAIKSETSHVLCSVYKTIRVFCCVALFISVSLTIICVIYI